MIKKALCTNLNKKIKRRQSLAFLYNETNGTKLSAIANNHENFEYIKF